MNPVIISLAGHVDIWFMTYTKRVKSAKMQKVILKHVSKTNLQQTRVQGRPWLLWHNDIIPTMELIFVYSLIVIRS